MKAPKILAVASAVDLDFRYGCTPAWWQLWKGLHEEGVDLVLSPYRGRPIESPWWRVAVVEDHGDAVALAQVRRDATQVGHRDREDDDRVRALALDELVEVLLPARRHPAPHRLARQPSGQPVLRVLLRAP